MELISNLNALDWLRSLPKESVDLIVTDPPYESLEKWRNIGTKARLKSNWFPVIPNSLFPELLEAFDYVLKPNSHCYLFCDAETMFTIKPMIDASGFKFWKPLVWDKKKIGMGYHYRARYEFILFFEKGKRKLKNFSMSDVFEFPKINNGYPTEKPVELAEQLIEQSTEPGNLVVDPFCGSGAFGVAAIQKGRRFLGNDLQEEAVSLSRQRCLAAHKTSSLGEAEGTTT